MNASDALGHRLSRFSSSCHHGRYRYRYRRRRRCRRRYHPPAASGRRPYCVSFPGASRRRPRQSYRCRFRITIGRKEDNINIFFGDDVRSHRGGRGADGEYQALHQEGGYGRELVTYGLFWKTLFVCEGKYRPQEGLEQVPRWYGMCQKCNDGRSSTFFYLVCGSGDEAYLLQQAFIGGHTRD